MISFSTYVLVGTVLFSMYCLWPYISVYVFFPKYHLPKNKSLLFSFNVDPFHSISHELLWVLRTILTWWNCRFVTRKNVTFRLRSPVPQWGDLQSPRSITTRRTGDWWFVLPLFCPKYIKIWLSHSKTTNQMLHLAICQQIGAPEIIGCSIFTKRSQLLDILFIWLKKGVKRPPNWGWDRPKSTEQPLLSRHREALSICKVWFSRWSSWQWHLRKTTWRSCPG